VVAVSQALVKNEGIARATKKSRKGKKEVRIIPPVDNRDFLGPTKERIGVGCHQRGKKENSRGKNGKKK